MDDKIMILCNDADDNVVEDNKNDSKIIDVINEDDTPILKQSNEIEEINDNDNDNNNNIIPKQPITWTKEEESLLQSTYDQLSNSPEYTSQKSILNKIYNDKIISRHSQLAISSKLNRLIKQRLEGVKIKGVWNTNLQNKLWLKYRFLKTTTKVPDDSDIAISLLLSKDKEFQNFSSSRLLTKISKLKASNYKLQQEHEQKKQQKQQKDEDGLEIDVFDSNGNNLQDTIKKLEIENDLLKLELQQLEFQVSQQQQQQQQQQEEQSTIPIKPIKLLPVNYETKIISSNSPIIIESGNQNVYVMFPTFPNFESVIKNVETIDGRYHVEIESKSKTVTNISYHYMKAYNSNIYEEKPQICKIKYNQVENNGILIKKKPIPVISIDGKDLNFVN